MEYDEELYEAARQKAVEALAKDPHSLVAGEIEQLGHALSVVESMGGGASVATDVMPEVVKQGYRESLHALLNSADESADPEDAVNPHGQFSARTPASVGALGKLREQVEGLEHIVNAVRSSIWHNVFRRLAELEQREHADREDGGIGVLAEAEKRLGKQVAERLEMRRQVDQQLQGQIHELQGRIAKLESQAHIDREDALDRLSRDELWTQLQGYMSTVDKMKERLEELALDVRGNLTIGHEGNADRIRGHARRLDKLKERVGQLELNVGRGVPDIQAFADLRKRVDALERRSNALREDLHAVTIDALPVEHHDELRKRVRHLEQKLEIAEGRLSALDGQGISGDDSDG